LKSTHHGYGARKHIPPFSFSTFAQAIALGRYTALFPLDADDNPILFVMGGRTARRLRDVLVWLVLHFITFERLFPGVQSWPGRKRASERQAVPFKIRHDPRQTPHRCR
jgi:hypothetical protein